MKFGTSVIIFFLAIIALVAEFILYMVFGFAAAFSRDLTALSGMAFFFVSLMVLTVATGVLAPICALVELIVKKKNIGVYTMVSILGLILVGLVVFSSIGIRTITETKLPTETKLSKERELKKENSSSVYWIKTRSANVRSGPSTNNSVISTLKQGNKVYPIERKGKWYKIGLGKEKEEVGWVHSSLFSKSFVKPAPTLEIVDIDTKVTESNDVWWKYAWRLTIRNSGASPVSLTATIEFQDKDGFIIDEDVEYNLYVPAGKVRTFTGYDLIDANAARNVSQVGAKVR